MLLTACSGGAPRGAAPEYAVAPEPLVHADFSRHFGDLEGTFVLLDGQSGGTLIHNAARARTRFSPASTYKIPHTVIALDSGVADGAGFALQRDASLAPHQPWWPAAWAQPHTLRTALRDSVVWYYQEIARRVGPARMKAYLDRFGYGNRRVIGGIDRFWLTGGLRISAAEQAEFLRRFYFGRLGVAARATRLTKALLVLEETPGYRLSGKTGWAGLGEQARPQIGWLVGYLERDGNVYFFALNIDMRGPEDAAARLRITRAILSDLGLLAERGHAPALPVPPTDLG